MNETGLDSGGAFLMSLRCNITQNTTHLLLVTTANLHQVHGANTPDQTSIHQMDAMVQRWDISWTISNSQQRGFGKSPTHHKEVLDNNDSQDIK